MRVKFSILSKLVSRYILEMRPLEHFILFVSFLYVSITIISDYSTYDFIHIRPPFSRAVTDLMSEGVIPFNTLKFLILLATSLVPIPMEYIHSDISLAGILGFTALVFSPSLRPDKFKTEMLLPISRHQYLMGRYIASLSIVLLYYFAFNIFIFTIVFGVEPRIWIWPVQYIPYIIFIVSTSFTISLLSRNEVVSILGSYTIFRSIYNLIEITAFRIFRVGTDKEVTLVLTGLGDAYREYMVYLVNPAISVPGSSEFNTVLTRYLFVSTVLLILSLLFILGTLVFVRRMEVD